MEKWYVMHTNPKKEAFVNGQLEDQGLETFFPYLQFDRGYGRGIRIEPFFPNYLFFYSDLQSVYAPNLQYIPGVRTIVRSDNWPAVVPNAVMDALRVRLEPYTHTVLKKTEWLFKPGDPVQIISGPFEGFDAMFEKGKSGQERVQVLLKLLGTWTRAEIDVKQIKSLGSAGNLQRAV